MELISGVRTFDSPFVNLIWYARSETPGAFTSEASAHWELAFTTLHGRTTVAARGPETRATHAEIPPDGEFFGISFKLGAFMPHLSVKTLRDRNDVILPGASRGYFWLHGSSWEIPTPDNADVFVNRLIRENLLVRDPLVEAALRGESPALSVRALQYRFIKATGLTHKTIQQIERAHQAAALIGRGVSVLDTVHELGYFDQAHLTHAIKRYLGKTPTQLAPKIVLADFAFFSNTPPSSNAMLEA